MASTTAEPRHPNNLTTQQYTFHTSQSNPPRPHPNRTRISSIKRCLILSLVFALIAIAITFVITMVWLLHRPHTPIFRLTSLSVSNFTLSNFHLTANYAINLTAKNPNKKISIYFEQPLISVLYNKTARLSSGRVHSFIVEKKSQMEVKVDDMRTNFSFVLNEEMGIEMEREWKRRRVVSFEAGIEILAKFRRLYGSTEVTVASRLNLYANWTNIADSSVPSSGSSTELSGLQV